MGWGLRQRDGSVLSLAVPLKAAAHRFAFVFLILSAFGLMLLGMAETALVERFRTSILDVVTPIMDVLSRPVASVSAAIEHIGELARLRDDNIQLRQDNVRLRKWQAASQRLAQENAAFREMLAYVTDPKTSFVSARVVADSGGAFVRTLLLNAGARHGVSRGQAVVTGDGLAGRIIRVGDRSARVLLITDLNSRIPVMVESTRVRAILAGNNSNHPRLDFLSNAAPVSPGARIVTSGHGGKFAPGLPVGHVMTTPDGGVRIEPVVDLDRLEYLRVINYGMIPPVAAPEAGPRAAAHLR